QTSKNLAILDSSPLRRRPLTPAGGRKSDATSHKNRLTIGPIVGGFAGFPREEMHRSRTCVDHFQSIVGIIQLDLFAISHSEAFHDPFWTTDQLSASTEIGALFGRAKGTARPRHLHRSCSGTAGQSLRFIKPQTHLLNYRMSRKKKCCGFLRRSLQQSVLTKTQEGRHLIGHDRVVHAIRDLATATCRGKIETKRNVHRQRLFTSSLVRAQPNDAT